MLRYALIIGWSVLISSAVLFFAFRAFPGLTPLLVKDRIPYLSFRYRFVPDPRLAFRYRQENFSIDSAAYLGDRWADGFSKSNQKVEYHANYRGGFRKNSASSCEVAVIGDSYIEIGETDDATLTEQLGHVSPHAFCNFGTGGYGPYQYIELLRRRVPPLSGIKVAVFTFFSGNDLNDLLNYEDWRRTGGYYFYNLGRISLLDEYFLTISGIASIFQSSIVGFFKRSDLAAPRFSDDYVYLSLKDAKLPMRFDYPVEEQTAGELLKRHEWKVLTKLLKEFRGLSERAGIKPVFLYIPRKIEIYAGVMTAEDPAVAKWLLSQRTFLNESREATLFAAREAGIEIIDLTDPFRARALAGELLYYPFDTHWSPSGRQVAAQAIAERLR